MVIKLAYDLGLGALPGQVPTVIKNIFSNSHFKVLLQDSILSTSITTVTSNFIQAYKINQSYDAFCQFILCK